MPKSDKIDRSTPEEESSSSQPVWRKPEKRISFRSLSPAVKRPASDMGAQDREEHTQASEMDIEKSPPASGDSGGGGQAEQASKAKQQNRGNNLKSDTTGVHESNPKSHSQTAPLKAPSAAEPAATPSSIATSGADIPSIDEQVQKVLSFVDQPLKDKQKGYIVSTKWMVRVLARSSINPLAEIKTDKSALEGDIGSVDNSDLVMITEDSDKLLDESGHPFVFLKPGLQNNEDYQILPEEAWNLIVQWYGVAKKSPIITRFAHNTSFDEITENIQYELTPPVFSLLKLPSSTGGSVKFLKGNDSPPIRQMASRSTPFMTWLRRAKEIAGIDMKTKVRVWRVLGGLKSSNKSGLVSPASSRSASPAPGSEIRANAGDTMIIDASTFAALKEGTQRDLIDTKDQTGNTNYNGSQTLDHAGLGRDEVILLEEQIGGPGGGEWASEGAKPSNLTVTKAASLEKKGKSISPAGRATAGPNVVTRGRQRRDGRTRGIVGLSNLGNTCYMNSALQCVRSVEELSQYFLNDTYKKDLNPDNPLSHNGEVAKAYANLLLQIYGDHSQSSFAPHHIKRTIGKYGPSFSGYGQQDSQEFLLFLLDGLQEDLNRVLKKPYIEKPDSTDEMVHNPQLLKEMADTCWDIYKARNDSVITDLFAGMYKSTLNCPICDKVSIIFDPFNNLTLQLPIENNWSKEIFFFPLHGKPIRVDVDIDKNASIKSLKEYVGKRMNADTKRMIMAEIYKCKLYKLFENPLAISECSIQPADSLAIFELESIPTNYNPDKVKRGHFPASRDDHIPSVDSAECDELLVPIFNRLSTPSAPRSQQKRIFGFPSFIVLKRSELKDFDAIRKKILANVANMTTRDILNEQDFGPTNIDTPEDADTDMMNDDNTSSESNAVQAKSVNSEEGLVDVSTSSSLQKEDDTKAAGRAKILQPGVPIPAGLNELYEIKIFQTGSMVPVGINAFEEAKDYPSIDTRLPRQQSEGSSNANSSEVSESSDADVDDSSPAEKMQLSGYESDIEPKNASGSDDDLPSPDSLLQRETKVPARKANKPPRRASFEYEGPIIGPGDTILLDWTPEAYDALFEGGESDQSELRGHPTWQNVEMWNDEELAAKRAQRQSRKRKGISLGDCLDEFGKEEILSENDAWYCPRCKEHRRASKKFELWKTPDILVMHLKRFSSNRNFRDKLEVLVDYPVEGLDMSERVLVKEEGKSMIYDLFAVDNHYGGLGGGHYTAYAKNFYDNQWYEYNDSHVSLRSDPKAVVTTAAYLLFYRRRSSTPLGGELLEKIVESAHTTKDQGESPSQSRTGSPTNESGEGRRLGDSSRNGSSSALVGVGAAHRAGDGGLAPQKVSAGASQEDGSHPRSKERMNDDLPDYAERDPMDIDEGFGEGSHPPAYTPGWGFDRLDMKDSSQTVAPPSSFTNEQEEDLFADEDASTRAEGLGRSTPGNLSDDDDRIHFIREEAPAPLSEDEDDELPVVELHP